MTTTRLTFTEDELRLLHHVIEVFMDGWEGNWDDDALTLQQLDERIQTTRRRLERARA